MQDEIKVSEGYQPAHQYISFVEGSSSEAPDPSSYPLQVLEADHNLNHLDGGDPTDGFAPWVTDILVYPSSEYWEGLLDGDKIRPYFDLSISNYNTLRVPSAIHNYDLYVDDATVYGDLVIHGEVTFSGEIEVSGSLNSVDITASGDITCNSITGQARITAPVKYVTQAEYNLSASETGTILQCDPSAGNTNFRFPNDATDGVYFTIMLTGTGKTVTFPNLQNAKGTQLTAKFSACTIYYASGWYGMGDLI
jgi:hypothetical protein